VLAVLAIACFPGLAQAEDNSGIQYESDVPTVPKDESSNIPSKNKTGGTNAPAESESEATNSNAQTGSGTGGGSDSGQGGGTPSGQGSQAGGGDGQKGQNGSQDSAGNIKAAESLPLTPAAETDDGGSSPLVPILIAVAVLAAISIGYFYYRQRKGPDSSGSSVSSPKAG
jgi:cobalamin biosynthesis Mg chelatase CobN